MQKDKETWDKRLEDVEAKAIEITTKDKYLQKYLNFSLASKKEIE